MTADAAAFSLAALPDWAFAFVLVLARVGAAITLLPGLGEAEPPAMLRAGFALGLTILLVPVIAPLMPPTPFGAVPAGVAQAAGMVTAEVATGLWLGWLARMLVMALPLAGQMASYMLGLSSVLTQDPESGGQTTALSRLFALAAPVIVLSSGLYALPIMALAGSYRLIPPGALIPAGAGVEAAVHAVTQSFAIALRLASPLVLASIVWHVATGLLARAAPRIQVYFLASPAQILGGLALLAALLATLLSAWEEAARSGFMDLPGLR